MQKLIITACTYLAFRHALLVVGLGATRLSLHLSRDTGVDSSLERIKSTHSTIEQGSKTV